MEAVEKIGMKSLYSVTLLLFLRMLAVPAVVSSGLFPTGLSYLNIPGPPLKSLTMGQLLDEAAEKWTNAEYLYDVPSNTRLSFGQLKKKVDLLASGLLKMGLRPGDRLGIWGSKNYRWMVTFLAGAKVGIIVVPLNPDYEAPELLYALNYVQIKCLILSEQVKTRNLYNILKKALPDMKISKDGDDDDGPIISSTLAPHLNRIISMGNNSLQGAWLWTNVQKFGDQQQGIENVGKLAETVKPDDVYSIFFTSGTTGRPKGTMISHSIQINGMLRIGRYWNITPQDRHCPTPPLSHQYGIVVGIMFPLCFGSSVIIDSPTFNPSAAIIAAANEKCTWIHGAPTMHFDMMNVPGFDLLDLSSLKRAVVSAAPPSRRLLIDMKEKYGIFKVDTAYGATEMNVVTLSRDEDPPELALTSVGFPVDNLEMKIIDARGRTVPVGEKGEVCVRSFSVMLGYWEDPEKTKEVIDSARWYHSGDVGYFLESGHLALVDRVKDMLIRGGENIYPKEIEEFLKNELEIEEVAVFGVSDERLGEVVAAWILPKPGVTMDTAHVKAVSEGKISRDKIPVYVKFVQSKEDFPRTRIGKVQKNVMRRLYEKELGLDQKQKQL